MWHRRGPKRNASMIQGAGVEGDLERGCETWEVKVGDRLAGAGAMINMINFDRGCR